MNRAEDIRNSEIAELDDRELLLTVIEPCEEIREEERSAFREMLRWVRTGPLTRRQRAWAEEAARRVVPVKAKRVPRGREVPMPEVLRVLPKRPPARKDTE